MFKLIAVSSAFVGIAQALIVNTPSSLVQCQPTMLSWGEGTAPYYLAIIPGGQPSAAALANLPTQTGNSYTWMVNLNAGTSITVKITDSTGAVNYSDQVTIQAGTSSTCGSSSAAAAPAGSSTPAGVAAAGATTAAARSSSVSVPALASSMSTIRTSATSGIGAAANAASSTPAAAATTTPASTSKSGATSLKAATGLLVGGLVLALAA